MTATHNLDPTEMLATLQTILARTPERTDNRATATIADDDRLEAIAEARRDERRWGRGDVERAEREWERQWDRQGGSL